MPKKRTSQGGSIETRYVTLEAISTRTGVTTRRVRYLERAGLIRPAESDEHFRLYHEETVERIQTIERLTNDLGVNLAGVEVILNMREQIIALRARAGLPVERPGERT
ncbi:MAG: MerR family transcriptional regulator [Thermomicrobiales bacterium]|nr:MerR family transcriptional regulator [Thermomicrobiales bacterium]MCO5221219.1 MerR family transcriptional regulator [Thermomicrobiales bacterium]